MIDPRFRFVAHDLYTCFEIGDTTVSLTRNIFSYDGSNNPGTGVVGITRLFNHPQLTHRYYSAVLEAENWADAAENRAEVAKIVADKSYVNNYVSVIEGRMKSEYDTGICK